MVILIDSAFRIGNNLLFSSVLEECRHVVTEKQMSEYINDGIQTSSDTDREDSDDENYNEENPDEENFEKIS